MSEYGYDPYDKPDVVPDWLRNPYTYDARVFCEFVLEQQRQLAKAMNVSLSQLDPGYDPYNSGVRVVMRIHALHSDGSHTYSMRNI